MTAITEEVFEELLAKLKPTLNKPGHMALAEGMALAMKTSMNDLDIDIETLAMLVGVAVKINHQMASIVESKSGDGLPLARIKAAVMLGLQAPVVAMRVKAGDLGDLPEELRDMLIEKIDDLPPELRERAAAALGIKPAGQAVH